MKHCPKSVIYCIMKVEDIKQKKQNDSRTKRNKSRS